MKSQVRLRDVEEADLPRLFEHQLDSVANEMAAFPAREREAFMVHWREILADEHVIKRTILLETEVAGNIVCFEQSERFLVGYWIGRRFWGRGIATSAVSEFVQIVTVRPLHAHVAKHNLASIRVLEKVGFSVSGEGRAAAATGGEVVDEFVYTLCR